MGLTRLLDPILETAGGLLNRDPSLFVGGLGSLVTALVGAGVASGVIPADLEGPLTKALLGLAPLVTALLIRIKAWAPESVDQAVTDAVKAEGGGVVRE